MRTRLTATKRIEDGLYLSTSVYPQIPRPKAGGMLLAFLGGALLFLLFCFIFIAIFA